MKNLPMKLLVLFCLCAPDAVAQVKLGRIVLSKINLERYPVEDVARALKDVHSRWDPHFREEFSKLRYIDQSNLVPSLFANGLLKELYVPERLFLLLKTRHDPMNWDLVAATFDVESTDQLTHEKILDRYFEKSPYLKRWALQASKAKDLEEEAILDLIGELYDVGEQTNDYATIPRFWKFLFERYRSIGDAVKGTSVESLFTDEAIETTLATAIAREVSRLGSYSDDRGTIDYKEKFHEDVKNADEALIDGIYYQVLEILEAYKQKGTSRKRHPNNE